MPYTPSLIQTVTVGTGIAPVPARPFKRLARGLYRRWGITPRPEDFCYLQL